MATNLPLSDTYGAAAQAYVPKKIKYTPNTLYKNLGQLRQRYETGATSIPDSNQEKQAAVFKYGNSLFNYGTEVAPDFRQGVPTGQSFLPEGDLRTPIPIDRATYGQFQAPAAYTQNGENLTWGTPVSPVIRQIKGSGITGQYVEDTANPDLLVKTVRPDEGKVSSSDKAILAGRPGWMYQIDHIMPLNLGGADTLANRQLLSQGENDKKTRAQAVAYTLYAHINPETGKNYMSLSEARNMAMQWKNQDVTDVPQPNTIGFVSDQAPQGILGMLPGAKGKTGLQIALEAQKKWSQPRTPTVKDVLAGIPEAAKDFGKGWLPDPLREFIKGAESAVTLGFIPYEQGEGQGMESKVAGILGRIVGTFAPFGAINAVTKIPYYFLGARKVFATALADKFLSGVARETLFSAAKTGVGMDLRSLSGAKAALYAAHLKQGGTLLGKSALTEAEMLTQAAARAKAIGINKAPGYLSKLFRDPKAVETATQFAITNAILSQATQYVGNHLSPQVLSGQTFEQDEKNILGNILKDLSLGALFGIQSRTLKGTAYATMLPVTIGLWSNPDDPVDAIVSGAVFGALHAHSVLSVPQKGFMSFPRFKVPEGYNNVEALGGKAYNDPMLKAQAHIVDHTAYAQASAYTDIIPKGIDVTKSVPKYTEEQLNRGRDESRDNVIRLLFGEPRKRTDTQEKQVAELKTLPEKINQELDTLGAPAAEKKTPSSLDNITKYFTPTGRAELRARSAENKEATEKIRTMFGEGWRTRLGEIGKTPAAKIAEEVSMIPGKPRQKPVIERPVADVAPEPQEGILNFEAARAEIARITVAYRHLYKLTLPHEGDPNIRGVVKEFRGKADLDDLFSVTKRHMGENSQTILDLLQRPEAVGRATETLLGAKDLRVTETFPKGFMEQKLFSTGEFKDKSFVTGPGLDILTPQAREFIGELLKVENGRYMGDASPTLIGVVRKELAPLLKQKNASLNPEKVASGESGIDPFPENAIQVFGVRKNANGEAYLVELGFIASNHRLNTGRNAMNKNAEQFELPKVGLNKDQIAEMANKEDLQIMLFNADPIMKAEGPMSGKPYLFVNISPQTIKASHAVQDIMFEQGYKNPFSTDAAKTSQAISGVQTKGMEAVIKNKEAMKNNPGRKDVSEYIPSYPPNTPVAPIAEVTKQVFQRSKEALNAESPAQLQENFQKTFGITLKETEAQELWNRKNDITLEEMGTRLIRAVDNNKTDVKTAIDVELMRDYIRSGALKYSDMGDAVLKMPVIGYGETPVARVVETPKEAIARSIEGIKEKYSGIEDQPYPGPLGLKPPAAETGAAQTIEPVSVSNTQEAVTQPASIPFEKNLMTGFAKEKALVVDKTTNPVRIQTRKPAAQSEGEIKRVSPTEAIVSNILPQELANSYLAEGKSAIENAQAAGRKHTAGSEEMVDSATRKLEDTHKSIISNIENQIQGDLQARNTSQEVINETKALVRSELNKDSLSILGLNHGRTPKDLINSDEALAEVGVTRDQAILYFERHGYKFDDPTDSSLGRGTLIAGQRPPSLEQEQAMRNYLPRGEEILPTPKVLGEEFFKGIDAGIMSTKSPPGQFLNKALDLGLKSVVGPGYRKNPDLPQILSDYFDSVFFSRVNKEGRERQQSQETLMARALGDWEAEKASFGRRRRQEEANKTGEGGTLTAAELRERGLDVESGDLSQTTVRPEHQEFGPDERPLVGDLTRGEDLMGALFADIPPSAAASVRAVQKLFVGEGKTGADGLAQFITSRLSPGKRPSMPFAKLVKEAMAADATNAIKTKLQSNKLSKAKELLSSLKKEVETIEKTIAPPEERPKWQTPEIVKSMEETIKEIQARMERGLKYLEETKSNGEGGPGYHDRGGGPGYHDGRGGPGEVFGAIKGAMKNLWNGGDVIGGLKGESVYNAPPKPIKPTYTVRGVTMDDDDLSEISKILLGEVSNRVDTSKGDMRPFEVRHIINTGINRVLANNPKEFGATLREVFQYPGAYQAYAPHGTTVSGGRVAKNDYQRAVAGELDYPTQQKLKIIQDTLNELKSGKFEDTTSGAKFYVHASDGTLWLGATGKEARQNANKHERNSGVRVTPWGTAVGLPVASPLAYKTLGK